jgi:hypothetical protein
MRHFISFYKDSHNSIVDQIAMVRLYPRLVTEEEVLLLENLCTKEEVREVLRGFTKDKSPGPDGWTVEFILHFFDLIIGDLLEAAEESYLSGMVNRSLNSTFIALISKVNGSDSFSEFWLITLCNLYYKIITKIIAKCIRPILSHTLSEEQFVFLKGRKIIDVIGIVRECIHNIREKNLQAMILKIDLNKAYDCISWDYLRLVLLQCGFGLPTTKWIMVCITTARYAILINGEPTEFFNSGRGLRQGCLLSPFLFLLVMEGLRLAIKKIQEEVLVMGIKVTRLIQILHLLFVDYILIMTKALVTEWLEIQKLLTIFCSATRLLINAHKTSFYQFGVQQQVLDSLKEIFLYRINNLTDGFRYLGYILKADRYKAKDWNWLLSKYENRISHWCNRWLTLGGG